MATLLRLVSVNDVYTLAHLPRLATLVAEARREVGPERVLVTLAGDFLAPSVLATLDGGRGMVECMNAIGFTHVTFGNHEDDVAIDELRQRTRELHATWLATNVPGFAPPLPASDVRTIDGVRVGLLGVCTDDPALYRRAPFGGARMVPARAAALAEAERLVRAEGCAFVIALTHQTLREDRELAAAVRHVPVLVGGHEHEPSLEQVGGVWIVKAGSDATHAVVSDIDLDGTVRDVRRVAVADYDEAPDVRALVDRHLERVRALDGATLLPVAPEEALSSVGARGQQTTFGAFVAALVRDAVGADACLLNAGGIRGERAYPRRVTFGDLEAEVPFDNEVVVAAMPGEVLSAAVAASRARAPSAGFLQVDDRVAVDASGHVVAVAGEPLEARRLYRVAIVRELLTGMDHEEVLLGWAREDARRVPPAGSGRGIKVLLLEAFARALFRRLGGFAALDGDGDGVVTRADIAAALVRALGGEASPRVADLVLHALDRDHDARVTREEAARA